MASLRGLTSSERLPLRVLLVEDNPADARLVREFLKEAGPAHVSVEHVGRLRQALQLLKDEGFSAILLDLSLPDSEGMDTFVTTRAAARGAPIVVLSGLTDEDVAVNAVREGAQDYLVKGRVDAQLLYHSIRYAVERHRSEDALRLSEERFRQLAENVKEAFVVFALPGYEVLYVSPVWAEIWGRPVEALQDDPGLWLGTIHAEDQPQVLEGRAAVERGGPATRVVRVLRPDGTARWTRERLFPVHDGDGRVYRAVGLVEDITEVRQTEEQFRQAQRMEAVGRLAGGVAHDFNNILTAILGYADLVVSDLGPSHPSIPDLDEIRKAGQSAVQLTRQLLAFSRRQILQPQIVDLNDVLRRMTSLLRRLIGEDVQLRMKLEKALHRVSADPGQVEQVLMNLVVNARDAMPLGGWLTLETGNVELDADYILQHQGASAGPHAMLAVSDTGTGMDEATRRRLFEPFFTTKGPGKGTGLGLATVYGIVKQSHGSIWVYSEAGQGSTFKIYLPAVAAQVDGAAPAPPRSPSVLTGTETVLLVEDQAEVRAVTRETLRRHGYTVIEASSGTDALALAGAHDGPIQLLLTDVVLPGVSGRRVAQQLAGQRPGIRVLYTSGYTDEAIVQHGVLEPGLAFVQKPYTSDVLLRRVREVLDAPEPPGV